LRFFEFAFKHLPKTDPLSITGLNGGGQMSITLGLLYQASRLRLKAIAASFVGGVTTGTNYSESRKNGKSEMWLNAWVTENRIQAICQKAFKEEFGEGRSIVRP
jgi:hypothetical protein